MERTISVKMSEELADQIEEYQEDDENRSQAVRRLVRAGLDAEQGVDPEAMSTALILSGITVLVLATGSSVGLTGAAIGAACLAIGLTGTDRIRRKARSLAARE